MNWQDIQQAIQEQWHLITSIELIAVLFSVTSVLMSYRNNVLLYPAGIISSGLFMYMMMQPAVGLYAEGVLQTYYLVMSFYGLFHWLKRTKQKEELSITKATKKEWQIVIGICVVAFVTFYLTLTKFTNSDVPVFDSFVSATAWAGMWLLARRKLENWILLNISNIVAIPLLFHKNLPLTALLTAFLFTVAVFGYFRWKRIMRAYPIQTKA